MNVAERNERLFREAAEFRTALPSSLQEVLTEVLTGPLMFIALGLVEQDHPMFTRACEEVYRTVNMISLAYTIADQDTRNSLGAVQWSDEANEIVATSEAHEFAHEFAAEAANMAEGWAAAPLPY